MGVVVVVAVVVFVVIVAVVCVVGGGGSRLLVLIFIITLPKIKIIRRVWFCCFGGLCRCRCCGRFPFNVLCRLPRGLLLTFKLCGRLARCPCRRVCAVLLPAGPLFGGIFLFFPLFLFSVCLQLEAASFPWAGEGGPPPPPPVYPSLVVGRLEFSPSARRGGSSPTSRY